MQKAKQPATEVEFHPDAAMNMGQRIAAFLDWAAVHRTKEWIPPNEILKYVMGMSKMPRVKSAEVELVKKSMSRARKILHEKYNRGLITKQGVGYRATVDALDRTKFDLTSRAKNLSRAAVRFKETHASIDPEKIPAKEKIWREWVASGARETVRQLADPAFERRLLPPTTPPADGEKK